MAEMVGSAVVQEVVSGAFSSIGNKHDELASQSHLLERLKMAYWGVKLALERARERPITEVCLLQQRMVIKHALEECRDVIYKHTVLRVNPEEQGVVLSPSLLNRIIHAVKLFFSTGKGSISGSDVRRFEWLAEIAEKFVRDVESGFSLARDRFSCPLITQLFERKYLGYKMESGSQTLWLSIHPSFLEDYGVVASLWFEFIDSETPTNCFSLSFLLRLSESTDIVGISAKCLQSLGELFKPVADVAVGELAQISTQVRSFIPEQAQREIWFNRDSSAARFVRQEPLCCIDDGFQPSANNTFSSELTERFPEQVSIFLFECFIPAAGYISEGSTIVKACPTLRLSVGFLPHFVNKIEYDKVRTEALTSRGEIWKPRHCSEILKFAAHVILEAVDYFELEPERTKYTKAWFVLHGTAFFTAKKPTTEMGYAPNGSKARRVSKRKR